MYELLARVFTETTASANPDAALRRAARGAVTFAGAARGRVRPEAGRVRREVPYPARRLLDAGIGVAAIGMRDRGEVARRPLRERHERRQRGPRLRGEVGRDAPELDALLVVVELVVDVADVELGPVDRQDVVGIGLGV